MKIQTGPTNTRLLLPFLMASVAIGASAQQPSVPPSKRPIQPMHQIQSIHHAVSEPLADLPTEVVVPFAFTVREQPRHKLPATGMKWPWHQDTAVQASPGPLLSATLGLNFQGLGAGQYGFTPPVVPPDTEGAVGATQYVQWVNQSYAVFNKSNGALVVGPFKGNALWKGFGGGCEADNDGDPITQYDKLASRWIMTQFAVSSGPPYLQCVAVSQTSDATGKWDLYSYAIVDFNNNNAPAFNDYPKLAIWPDGYYMSWLLFNPTSNATIGALTCALDRNAMLSGLPSASAQCVEFLWSNWPGLLLNSDLDGTALPPAGSPNYLIMPAADAGPAQDFGMNLFRYYVDWKTPANTIMYYTNTISTAQYVPLCIGPSGSMFEQVPCIPQKGTAQLLDSLGDRVMYRLAYRQLAGHDAMLLTHSVSTNAAGNGAPPGGVRWYEFRNVYNVPVCNPTCVWTTPTIFQQGTFQPDSTTRWMPSIAMDKAGDIALGYSMSNSSTVDPSVGITGRIPTDALGTLEAETIAVTGTNPQPVENCGGVACGERWGDYSAMTVDPADDCTFWYTQEYYKSTLQFAWNTRITNLKFSGCTSMVNFSLSMTPTVRRIAAGSSTTYTVTVSPSGGFTGTVTLAVSGLPTGATGTFNPTNIAGGSGSSTLTITTAGTTPTGGSTIRVTGTSGSRSHSTDSALSINLPHITSLSPTSGPVGTPVAITGSGFGGTQGTSTVKFNGTTATPTSWTTTTINVPVPSAATTGVVQVTVNGHGSNLVAFTVKPHITSLMPTSAITGTSVTINGTTFGGTQGTSTVKFNGALATPTSWTATKVIAPVPSGATTGNVVVTVSGQASNGVAFTVIPHITSLSPTAGPVGTSVTITGTAFGTTQGTSTVKFNGTAATPSSWGNKSIKVPVPSGASTGPVVVTVGGHASNGVTFTVN